MQNELISEGLTLMLAGMGTVFVFLTALVAVMTVMSRVLSGAQPAAVSDGDDYDIVAAITAAIDLHRRR